MTQKIPKLREDIQNFYNAVQANMPFVNMHECDECTLKCHNETRIRQLLPAEAERLKDYINVQEGQDGSFFFAAEDYVRDGDLDLSVFGRCRQLKNGKCQIYEYRPIECRLYPVAIHKIRGEFYWVLYTECGFVKNRVLDGNDKKEFMILVNHFIDLIEPTVGDYVLRCVANNFKFIDEVHPFIKDKDYVVIREVRT